MKKIISFALCLVMIFALAVPAFAAEPVVEIMPIKTTSSTRDTTIIMQHTDVVVRAAPGTSNPKLGTLYVGESVVVTNWTYQKIGDYWWVQIRWGSGFGYVRGDLIP